MESSYWDENNIEINPLGAIEIVINTENYKANDELYIYCSAGKLVNDGGDEYTVNAVAELEEYTYGIGGPDTEYLEWTFWLIASLAYMIACFESFIVTKTFITVKENMHWRRPSAIHSHFPLVFCM